MQRQHDRPLRILAVSSAGPRWFELNAVADAFRGAELHLVAAGAAGDQIPAAHDVVRDFSLFSIWNAPSCVLKLARIVLRTKPDIVLSTGAAPGVAALAIGRLYGARTIWIESIASVGSISLSGRIAAMFAVYWISQWELTSNRYKPGYIGGLL